MTTKPKTRKAALEEMETGLPGRAIVDAGDVLAEAANLTDAVTLIALELNEYECGAICSVADACLRYLTWTLVLDDFEV